MKSVEPSPTPEATKAMEWDPPHSISHSVISRTTSGVCSKRQELLAHLDDLLLALSPNIDGSAAPSSEARK